MLRPHWEADWAITLKCIQWVEMQSQGQSHGNKTKQGIKTMKQRKTDCCQLYAESSWCLYKPLRPLLGALYSSVGPASNAIWSWPAPPTWAAQGEPLSHLSQPPQVRVVWLLETTETVDGRAWLPEQGLAFCVCHHLSSSVITEGKIKSWSLEIKLKFPVCVLLIWP